MEIRSYTNIDEYIANFNTEQQKILKKIRQTIQDVAPEATEKISYGIPTFAYHGNLVHFAVYKKHIGFYPGPEAIKAFTPELKEYKTAPGTIRFPLDKPIPYDLIKKITEFCVDSNKEKSNDQKETKSKI